MNCKICEVEFLLEKDGGVTGTFGTVPIAFCHDCLSSCKDMVFQLEGWDDHELDS